jgi:glycosyltransferase involved in cell wall biosynthesis
LKEIKSIQSDSQTQPVLAIQIPNPIDTSIFRSAETSPDHRHGVLWIGRADRFHKRPHLAIEIAARCPDIPFTMILNPSEDAVYREILDAKPPNVAIVDFVPASEMSKRMSRAWLFLSTGSADYEGFPNVFLEASASGTPIVSLEDFDGFLTRSGGGLSGDGRVDQVVENFLQLNTSPTVWMQLSRNARSYVCQHHERTAVVQKFRTWLEAIVFAHRV